jgi:hypothetical protein
MTFILAYLLTFPALMALILLGIIFEFYDNVLSVYTGIAAALVAYFMYNIPLNTLAIYAGIYLVIGIIWSFWRFKRYTDQKVEEYNENLIKRAIDHERLMHQISLKACTGRIVAWITVWPFSMIENLTSDIVKLLKSLVTDVLKYFYTIIINNAVSKIDTSQTK